MNATTDIVTQAKDFYSNELGINFTDDAFTYLIGGYFYKTPTGLIFGKPIRRDGGTPDEQWNVENPDTWYVKFAIGDCGIGWFVNLLPYPLKWVAWQRCLKTDQVKWFDCKKIFNRYEK